MTTPTLHHLASLAARDPSLLPILADELEERGETERAEAVRGFADPKALSLAVCRLRRVSVGNRWEADCPCAYCQVSADDFLRGDGVWKFPASAEYEIPRLYGSLVLAAALGDGAG